MVCALLAAVQRTSRSANVHADVGTTVSRRAFIQKPNMQLAYFLCGTPSVWTVLLSRVAISDYL